MPNELVFIDDSGDPGFKLDKGSSSHFVIACLIFDDPIDAEESALVLKKYRRELGWDSRYEFKFNKMAKKHIKEILTRVSRCNFRIRAICIDKKRIRSYELRNNVVSFYNYAIKEVLAKTDSIGNAKIRLDGHADREYKRAASSYLRKEVNLSSAKISKIKFVDSKTDNLIQLTDLIAGSLLRSTQSNKTDNKVYKEIIKNKIEDLWFFK